MPEPLPYRPPEPRGRGRRSHWLLALLIAFGVMAMVVGYCSSLSRQPPSSAPSGGFPSRR